MLILLQEMAGNMLQWMLAGMTHGFLRYVTMLHLKMLGLSFGLMLVLLIRNQKLTRNCRNGHLGEFVVSKLTL